MLWMVLLDQFVLHRSNLQHLVTRLCNAWDRHVQTLFDIKDVKLAWANKSLRYINVMRRKSVRLKQVDGRRV